MWNEYRYVEKSGKIVGEVRPNWRGHVSAYVFYPGLKPVHLGEWVSIEGACCAVENAHKEGEEKKHHDEPLLLRIARLEEIIKQRTAA